VARAREPRTGREATRSREAILVATSLGFVILISQPNPFL
jgi:hypothetical protein